ncbi:hypothetical protein AB0I28_31020 [Phytomonospora sp. NPDC050363]|uniref:hypothetical protein n=1 Tax=Phytomonospora sp. NPDC050363 TaxID=3155642 RepID=UPI0033F1BE85
MTRELERVLRATFEDRTQPVPPQSEDLADSVIGRARGVRRRRAMTGAASALAVVVLAGFGLVFGREFLQPEEAVPSGDQLTVPVIQGLDVAVPKPADGKDPYLQTGDGVRVALPGGESLDKAVRLPEGYLAITTKDDSARLVYYPLSGPAVPITDGKNLSMAVDMTAENVAVSRTEGVAVRLDVYDLNGLLTATRQVAPESVLEGWSAGLVMYREPTGLHAWDPPADAVMSAPEDQNLRFMGSSVDWKTYALFETPTQTCLVTVVPTEGFDIDLDYCYDGVIPSEVIGVSPNGDWFVGRGMSEPTGESEFISTYLAQDLISDNAGSMANLGVTDVSDWVWESESSILYRTPNGWYRMDLYSRSSEALAIPPGSSAYPIPRAFTG